MWSTAHLNPLSASSSCNEEQPTSSSTPSTAPCNSGKVLLSSAKLACLSSTRGACGSNVDLASANANSSQSTPTRRAAGDASRSILACPPHPTVPSTYSPADL